MGAIAAIAFGAKAIGDVVGAVSGANAQREQAKYQEHQYNQNAKMAEDQAADTIRLGDLEANQAGKKADAVRGSQRVAYANQGVDVNTGAAAETQADTVALGQLDMVTIKENAWRTAWGYKVEAANSRGKGAMTRAAGESAANTTLLTGGLNALGNLARGGMALNGAMGGGKGAASSVKSSDDWYGNRGPNSR